MLWLEPLSRLILALWWGSLTSLGLWVVPQLFIHLGVPAMAGTLAGHLFTTQNLVGLSAAVLYLLLQVLQGGWMVLRRWHPGGILALLVMAIGFSQGVVFPLIIARDNLPLWHSVGSALFVLEWLGLTWLMWRQNAVTTVSMEQP